MAGGRGGITASGGRAARCGRLGDQRFQIDESIKPSGMAAARREWRRHEALAAASEAAAQRAAPERHAAGGGWASGSEGWQATAGDDSQGRTEVERRDCAQALRRRKGLG